MPKLRTTQELAASLRGRRQAEAKAQLTAATAGAQARALRARADRARAEEQRRAEADARARQAAVAEVASALAGHLTWLGLQPDGHRLVQWVFDQVDAAAGKRGAR